MSTALASSATFSVTGVPKVLPTAGTEMTLPVAAETTCTPPEVSTAIAATPPAVASGLDAVDSVRPDSGALASTRWAHTLPVRGSTMARVPPRRSPVAGTNSWSTGLAFCGSWTGEVESSRPVSGSMGTSWLPVVRMPPTAVPSCSTSRPAPGVTLAWIPASN